MIIHENALRVDSGKIASTANWNVSFTPLNPNIKIQILDCDPNTFPVEVVGRTSLSIKEKFDAHS